MIEFFKEHFELVGGFGYGIFAMITQINIVEAGFNAIVITILTYFAKVFAQWLHKQMKKWF